MVSLKLTKQHVDCPCIMRQKFFKLPESSSNPVQLMYFPRIYILNQAKKVESSLQKALVNSIDIKFLILI